MQGAHAHAIKITPNVPICPNVFVPFTSYWIHWQSPQGAQTCRLFRLHLPVPPSRSCEMNDQSRLGCGVSREDTEIIAHVRYVWIILSFSDLLNQSESYIVLVRIRVRQNAIIGAHVQLQNVMSYVWSMIHKLLVYKIYNILYTYIHNLLCF